MHNIRFWDYREDCNRGSVLSEISEYAMCNGDGYSGPVRWHDDLPVAKNREEAEEIIRKLDNGWYDDHAVRYYDYSEAKETKKIQDMKKRAEELAAKIGEYAREHTVRNFKANLIGCAKCGSRVSREYLRSDRCPVCGGDLRSESVIAGEKALYAKRAKLWENIKEETEKQEKIRKVRWLVKFEFHS